MPDAPATVRARPLRASTVGLIAAGIAAVLLVTGALDGPERTSWDWRVRLLATPTEATNEVVLVLVDQDSLQDMSSLNAIDWPWPRSLYGFMLEFLREAGAATVTFDIILEDGGRFGVDDDRELLAAARQFAGTIYGVELLSGGETRGDGAADPWPSYIRRPALRIDGLDPETVTGRRFSGGSFPSPQSRSCG